MDDELMHYGVKGMKWGVRRTQAQLGHKTSSGTGKKKSSKSSGSVTKTLKKTGKKVSNLYSKNKASRQAKKTAKVEAEKAKKKKSISEMSDAELREKIGRLELEQRYKQLYAAKNPNAGKGKKFVTNVLERSGEQLATQVANHYGAKVLNKMIGEEVIFANNKKK